MVPLRKGFLSLKLQNRHTHTHLLRGNYADYSSYSYLFILQNIILYTRIKAEFLIHQKNMIRLYRSCSSHRRRWMSISCSVSRMVIVVKLVTVTELFLFRSDIIVITPQSSTQKVSPRPQDTYLKKNMVEKGTKCQLLFSNSCMTIYIHKIVWGQEIGSFFVTNPEKQE
jgi:hypothetical protein